MSAGIPSDHQQLQLSDSSTSPRRRQKRSYSLERSRNMNEMRAEKKRSRHMTALMDPTAGSSSVDDSEDGMTPRDKLKAKFLAEIKERKRQEETAKHLQQNYENLLRRHAEKEITIEQLRLGARVSLVCDPPTASHIETGSVAKPQHAHVFNVPKPALATTGSSSLSHSGQLGTMLNGSTTRPSHSGQQLGMTSGGGGGASTTANGSHRGGSVVNAMNSSLDDRIEPAFGGSTQFRQHNEQTGRVIDLYFSCTRQLPVNSLTRL